MIGLLLFVACETPAATAAPAIVPNEGAWRVTWAETYEGDCALEDLSTGRTEEAWRLESSEHGFRFYDSTDYPLGCALDGAAFTCSDGEYHIPWADADAIETFATDYSGTFTDGATFEARRDIAASCEGADCEAVGTQYGPDFTYPCTAIAGFSGAWSGG